MRKRNGELDHQTATRSREDDSYSYSRVAVELVSVVGGVEDGDGDDGGLTVVVPPMGDPCGQGKDVSLSEAPDLLVLFPG